MSDQVKKTLTNTGDETRRWDGLQRVDDKFDNDGRISASVGSTLELEPGESADVMVDAEFSDPWLKEAKVGAPKRGGKEPIKSEITKVEA